MLLVRRSVMPALVLLAACVSVNKSVLSSARVGQPVPGPDVTVYFADDSIPTHERIAILYARGDAEFTHQGQLIDKLRQEAGKLGANAIILDQVKDPSTGERVAAALFGISAERRGQAMAIFIPPTR